ncbi:MAG: hypothetical protein ACJ75B_11480 [Flavisolibacter sp.]
MIRNRSGGFMPVIVFFVLTNIFFIAGSQLLKKWNASQEVLIIGNALLFLITVISYLMARRGMKHSNPHVFIRAVYASIMIKLFVCMIAAFVYISIYKKNLNKAALFTCMGLYVFYTFMEVSILMRQLKQLKNG